MKNDPEAQLKSYSEFSRLFSNAISTYQFVKRFMGVSLFVMFVFGVLIWCILFGLFFAFALIALISDPAYQLFQKLLNLPNMPSRFVKPPLSRFLYIFASLVIPSFFIFIGIRGFSLIGFCTQSLVCILINLIHRLL